MAGKGLDIGYRGSLPDAVPVTPDAVGIELDFPGYDGKTLPFPDASQDFVCASHCLEHIRDYWTALREWFRVLRDGGFLIVAVPHQFLYEKRTRVPSRFNADHKRFYTPASLLREVERSLKANTYRVRLLRDCDFGYDYTVSPDSHSRGEYQIELAIQKITPAKWELDDDRSVFRKGTLIERIWRRGTALLRDTL
jgi:SAM-dependent methyltransferase